MDTMASVAFGLGARLIEVATRNSASIILDRVSATKVKGSIETVINEQSEIITALIADKNELVQICQGYQQEIQMNQISDDDIAFITNKFTEIIGIFSNTPQYDTEEENRLAEKIQQMKALQTLVSPETLKIFQLLGFNYKEAIGKPLTEFVALWIDGATQKMTNNNAHKSSNNRSLGTASKAKNR